MKKRSSLLSLLLVLLLINFANAQSNTGGSYFVGKWKVSIPGTPIGDLKRIYVIDKMNDSFSAVVQDSTGKEITKCSKVEARENDITLFYSVSGIDAYIKLTRKDEDHVSGLVLDTYQAQGERMKK